MTNDAAGAWIKSSYSMANGDCIEVAVMAASKEGSGHVVAVRDSKDPDGPALLYTPAEWAAFLDGCKNGEFDDLAG